MPKWTEVALGEILTLQRGFDLPKRLRKEGPYPVVSSSGVTGWHDEFKVEPPGVVIGRYGTLGSVHWVTERFWPLNTSLWVKDFKGNDPRFLSYLLRIVAVDGSTASAVPGINRNHLQKLRVLFPPLREQRHIGAVLSAFDELIEINERRIEVLQAFAEFLHRNWFVRFRFPGHSGVELVESEAGPIPQGWVIESFADIAEFRNGFAFKPAHRRESGLPIIKIKELKQGVTISTPRCSEVEIDPKFIVEPGDLLFSWSADLGVYLWPGERGALNQHLFKVKASDPKMQPFVFHSLKSALPEFKARAQGTTMRHIKRSALSEVKVPVPTEDLLVAFCRCVEPLHARVVALRRENEVLRRTRDLLLPRLVTGQLDISDIDLGVLTPPESE